MTMNGVIDIATMGSHGNSLWAVVRAEKVNQPCFNITVISIGDATPLDSQFSLLTRPDVRKESALTLSLGPGPACGPCGRVAVSV